MSNITDWLMPKVVNKSNPIYIPKRSMVIKNKIKNKIKRKRNKRR